MDETTQDQNSKRTRIEPVFGWLKQNGDPDWPTTLLRIAEGVSVQTGLGALSGVYCEEERTASPTPTRLAWMIRNAHRLSPSDGRRYREYARRVSHPQRDAVLRRLDAGDASGIPAQLRLEGDSCCDCLIECEHAFVWVEGKRNDWLSTSTTWDVSRDQLARNLEAVWSLARKHEKDYWLLLCHEGELKHHEECLIQGYRTGAWWAGWPHVDAATRDQFRGKIASIRWDRIVQRWPELRSLAALADVA